MRKYYVTVAVILVATLLSGCSRNTAPGVESTSIVGSGDIITVEETFTGFDKIQVSHTFQVDVQQGDTYSVVVRIDDNLIEHLRLAKDDDDDSALVIGIDPSFNYSLERVTMEAEVTMPSLTRVDVSGSSDVTVTGFASSEYLAVGIFGGSSLAGDIEAGDAQFTVSGASELALSGSAHNLTADAFGGSKIDLVDFAVIDAYVHVTGSSEVEVSVAGKLDADATGSSRVYYTGDPTLGSIHHSGTSSVLGR